MKNLLLVKSILVAGLIFSGCTSTSNVTIQQPNEKVKHLIEQYKLQSVDYNYVKKAIGNGTSATAKAILVDARPNAKYLKSTIPTSINIPDTKFEQYYKILEKVSKDKEIIVYCGGYACEKSPIVADLLIKKGFNNVKVYPGGEPEWIKNNYAEVDTVVVKAAMNNNSAVLIDARPYKLYLKETIVGAISIPDTQLEELVGRFPANKDEKIIVFCGGFKCEKSHIVADKLVALGYKNVFVYAGGVPQWKKEKLPTTAGAKVAEVAKVSAKKQFSAKGLKLGSDEGTVDGDWLKVQLLANNVPSFIQIVDVRSKAEFEEGHFKNAINIEAGKLTAKELYEKLPKDKTVVFNCSAGGRSLEAWAKLNDEKYDVSEIYYFDANISCKGNNCTIEVNEPLE